MVVLVPAAMTNIADWVAYKPQGFISHSSAGWKFEIRGIGMVGSGEGPLLGCKLLTSRCIFMLEGGRESSLGSLVWRVLILFVCTPLS